MMFEERTSALATWSGPGITPNLTPIECGSTRESKEENVHEDDVSADIV